MRFILDSASKPLPGTASIPREPVSETPPQAPDHDDRMAQRERELAELNERPKRRKELLVNYHVDDINDVAMLCLWTRIKSVLKWGETIPVKLTVAGTYIPGLDREYRCGRRVKKERSSE